MKVLLLGSHLNYNLEHYTQMNFQKMNAEVVFYGYREKLGKLATPIRMAICRSEGFRHFIQLIALKKINEEIKRIAEEFMPDLVLSIKGEAVEPKTIEWIKNEIGAKTALWYPDDPRFFKTLAKSTAPSYDHVFTASERAVNTYRKLGIKAVHYLPFACEPSVHKKVEFNDEGSKRCYADVIFVGTFYPRRAKFIRALERVGIKVKVCGPYWNYFKRGRNVFAGLYGPEMVYAFNAAKIVLNIHVADDLEYKTNMRVFEALGSGAFLLTDRPWGLENLLVPGKELVTYKTEKELIDLAKFYLRSEDDRREIALNGIKRVHEEHTYEERVREIVEKTNCQSNIRFRDYLKA